MTTTKKPYPSTMDNQLFSINLIQSGYPNIVSLSIHQLIPQMLIFPPHRLKHHLSTRLSWIRAPPTGRGKTFEASMVVRGRTWAYETGDGRAYVVIS